MPADAAFFGSRSRDLRRRRIYLAPRCERTNEAAGAPIPMRAALLALLHLGAALGTVINNLAQPPTCDAAADGAADGGACTVSAANKALRVRAAPSRRARPRGPPRVPLPRPCASPPRTRHLPRAHT